MDMNVIAPANLFELYPEYVIHTDEHWHNNEIVEIVNESQKPIIVIAMPSATHFTAPFLSTVISI